MAARRTRTAPMGSTRNPRMASRSLTAPDVVKALQEQNVEGAAGQVGQPPIKSGQDFQISVRAVGRLTEASEFDNIILKTNSDGTPVRVTGPH